MALKQLSTYLKNQTIEHEYYEVSDKDPMGRIVVPVTIKGSVKEIQIIQVFHFETWVEHAILWQFFIEFTEENMLSIDIDSLNYQLPVGFIAKMQDNTGYYKYSYWVSNESPNDKIEEAIFVISGILDGIL